MRLIAAVAALGSGVLAAASGRAEAAVPGTRVDNVAAVSWVAGGAPGAVTTPPASFVIEPPRTPSTIEFFRYAPMAPDAIRVLLNGSDYEGAGGAFQPVGPLVAAGGAALNTGAPVPLAPAGAYYSGEPIIIRVTDAGQNADPAAVETIVATIRTANGDFVTLRLYESGPDTGQFYAYVGSNSGTPVQNDPVLTIVHGAGITARYQDPFDPTEVSTDAAGVDPFGRVFDSLTGVLIDGATVTIIDDATGLPAQVFGVDGVSAYPSTIVTGSVVTDAGGMVYTLSPGEFRFPIMGPGTYRLVVTPPSGYTAPSAVQAPSFTSLPNAPFTIIPASYAQTFTLAGTGDVEFDFPLDPITDLVVQKTADVETAAIGDFVRYQVTIENRAATAFDARIADAPPAGFRYQQGSARLDGAPIGDPVLAADGGLTFALGVLAPGASATLVYVAEVGAGAKTGAAVNRASAVSLAGVVVSNRAEASVLIEDDFLRERLTIVGRITEDGCEGAGKGVKDVRLYMETGATVVTDENGLYHFEDVTPRTHVVQVDEESLPEGYELVQCLDNTRYAGSARSQFVDATGGKIWRANFHVRRLPSPRGGGVGGEGSAGDRPRNDEVGTLTPAPLPRGEGSAFNPDREYLAFDKVWLNQELPGNGWAYPAEGVTPAAPTVNLGLKHDAKLRPTLYLNGREVPLENFAGRDVSIMRTLALSRWRGVDLLEGANRFEAVLKDASGAEIARLTRTIDFIERAERAVLVPGETSAVADGRTRPVIAIRVTDGAGRPVRAGRILDVGIAPPYRGATRQAIEENRPLDAPLSANSGVPVGQNGVARIELEPTVDTGLASVTVKLEGGAERTFTAYVKPARRDFIIVGLAEGEGSYEKGHGAAASARDLLGDGRIAGFAKGTVKGDWLVTIAGDSKNERGAADDELFEVVDPDDRYALYGDRSRQTFEAQSRYPVYLKAEKDGFKAEFGDYRTGLTQSKLSRYDRRLSGLNTVYQGERFSFSGFAAETNQAFVKDERAADGTSGPYQLSAAPLVRNSEQIVIETRDRFRPDVVLASVPLIRYADYDIDFATGEIILRLPAPAADAAFNPNVLVIDYETAAPVDRNLTAGGRGAVKFLGGRGEAGATVIREESPGVAGATTTLAGADVVVEVTGKDSLRLEYATTDSEGGLTVGERAHAVLAEASHVGERLSAKAYYSEIDDGFGLAQQSSAAAGVRRFGAEASYKFDEFESKDGAARGGRFVDAKAYREENLQTGASRDVAELGVRQESTTTSGAVGLRAVREEPETGPEREGLFALASAKQRFDKLGLSLRAAREQSIAGDDASALFPTRTSLGFDQKLFDGFTLSATHEILDGAAVSQSNTIVGLVAEPWTGGKVTVSGDRLTQDSAERIGATFAVDQQVKLSEKWTGTLGLARREDLKERGAVDTPDDIVPDIPTSPFEETGGAYTSLYVGAGYRDGATSGSSRFEMKKSGVGQRYMVAAGAARELSEKFSLAAAGRYQADNNEVLADERRFDARIGAAFRPRDDGLIILNRFDVKQRQTDLQSTSWKAVHNLTVNAMLGERLQVALNHGLKYSVLEADGATHRGVTALLGGEARYDVRDWLDLGAHAEAIHSFNAGTTEYAFGPTLGVTPAENVWLSFGWNFAGFVDEDFAAAEYSREGPWLKLRVKFDQTTAKGLLAAITPEGGR